jgi:cytoskeletal protein CcmA (bactofilin family)
LSSKWEEEMSKKHLILVGLLVFVLGCASRKQEEYAEDTGDGQATEQNFGANYPTLQEDSDFEGIIETQGNLTVKGRVKGAILANGVVVITRTGYVECDSLMAYDVIVQGYVKGKVQAIGKIQLDTNAVLVGSAYCKNLIVNGGAIFQSETEMAGYKREKGLQYKGERSAGRRRGIKH